MPETDEPSIKSEQSNSDSEGMPVPPKPSGLLSLAMANLIQNRGQPHALEPWVPDEANRSMLERLDEVAAAQPEAEGLNRIMRSIRHWETGLLGFMILIVINALGAMAAAGSLDAPDGRPVNLFWILGAILGGQTILLVLWVVLALFGGRFLRRFSLGGILAGGSRLLASQFTPKRRRSSARSHQQIDAASSAVTHADFGGARARWALGALTHLSWTLFNIGLLIGLLVILSIRQFDFGWETTIGSEAAFKQIAEVISRAPAAVGFDIPTNEEFESARIDDSGNTASAGSARRAFSGLIIGSVVLYGLLPRFILMLACWGLWRRARRGWEPDVESPSFAPLRALADPRPVTIDSTSPSEEQADQETPAELIDPRRSSRGSTIIGIELETPACGWPPPCDATVTDLGVLASREDRAAITRRLAIAEHAPSRLVVFADLSTTPDRGVARSIRQLHDATNDAILRVVLSGGERFRARRDARVLEQRIADWNTMVEALEVEGTVTELDLDHLTAETRARLNELIAGKGRPELPQERGVLGVIDTAFAEIGAHVRRWPEAPDSKDLLALHKAVARCAGAHSTEDLTGLPSAQDLIDQPGQAFQQAADRITQLLPSRLSSSARWMAIGGTVGIVACLASAGTLAPAALAVLPGWLASGAAAGGLLSLLAPQSAEEHTTPPLSRDEIGTLRGEAVSSAAMLTLVLTLQGRGERFIQETIDRTFTGEPPSFADVEQIGACLAAWRAEVAAILEERALQ